MPERRNGYVMKDKGQDRIFLSKLKELLENSQGKASEDILSDVKKLCKERWDSALDDADIVIDTPIDGLCLHNEFLSIKPLGDQDKTPYLLLKAEIVNKPEITDTESFQRLVWKEALGNKHRYYAIYRNADHSFIGFCGINDIREEPWELAVELLKKYHHQGYGYMAVKLLIETIKNLTGRQNILATVSTDNFASQALMRKLGAVASGLDETDPRAFSKMNEEKEQALNIQDDRVLKLIEEFHVDVQDLRGKVLLYMIPLDEQREVR